MTSADREKLVSALSESRETWLTALEGCSNITQRPAPDCWSVLEIAEHVATVENRLLHVIKNAREGEPPLPADEEREHTFLRQMANRERRFAAPEIVLPPGRMQTLEEAIASFEAGRAHAIEYVESGVDLRSKTAKHLLFGPVSGYEMTLILASHAMRHAGQVAEVRAAVSGPRS